MKKPKMDFSIPEDMDTREFDEIYTELERYSVKYPDESSIDETIDTLRMYMPQKNGRAWGYAGRFKFLLNLASAEIGFMSKSYWIISIILFLLGCEFTIENNGDPYAAVLFLAPVPFVLGIVEVFRGREEGMLEIELSCRISAGEVMLSRILLIGIYSVLFDSLFTMILEVYLPGINMMKVLLSWMTPLTFISGLSLWVAMKIRANYAAAIFISGWAAIVFVITTRKGISDWLMSLNVFIYIVIVLSGIAVVLLEARRITNIYSTDGRGAAFEIND